MTIVSSDKDLMQLIRPGVDMLDPIKQKPIGPAEVMEKFGVTPDKMVEVQALIGDSTDNVPGVPGHRPQGCGATDQRIRRPGGRAGGRAGDEAVQAPRHADRACRKGPDFPRAGAAAGGYAAAACRWTRWACATPTGRSWSAWLTKQGFRSTIARLGLDGAGASRRPRLSRRRAGPGRRLQADLGLAPPPTESGFGPYESVTSAEALRRLGRRGDRPSAGSPWTPRPTGLDPMRARLIGFSLATGAGRACYVPLAHEVLGEQIKLADAIEVLAPLLTDPSVLKIFQNAKFDMMMLSRAGFPMPAPVDDTMLISYAQEAGMHGHGLEELSQLHLGHTPITLGRGDRHRPQPPAVRAGADRPRHGLCGRGRRRRAAAVGRAAARLRLNGGLALYEQVERRLLPILLEMERAGVKVDADDLRRMSVDFEARMAVMEQDCHRLAGHPFNVGSPKQLGEVLFDEQKLPGGKRMKTGAWGTDSSVLQALADQGHELPNRILEWRQLAKLKIAPMPTRW